MYSNTLKWKSPRYIEKEERAARNIARSKFCKYSFAWTENLNMEVHRVEVKKMYDEYDAKKRAAAETEENRPFRAAMSSKTTPEPSHWKTDHGAVTALRTIFVPDSDVRVDDRADWPTQKEMYNEGDDRIQKDQPNHLRMLATPRTSGNDTVAVLLRRFIDFHRLDDFRSNLDEESILFREFDIGDLMFDDEQGNDILGRDLMAEIDPVDRL